MNTKKDSANNKKAALTFKITTEGTLNLQLLYESYIKLGIDRIVLKYESQVNESSSA